MEIEVRAKLPDNTINELFAGDLLVELPQVIDVNTFITVKQSGNYQQAVQQLQNLTPQSEIQLVKYQMKTGDINATQHPNPMDNYPELETSIANLKNEQLSDQLITKVMKWMKLQDTTTTNQYSTGDEQKYLRQLPRLFIES